MKKVLAVAIAVIFNSLAQAQLTHDSPQWNLELSIPAQYSFSGNTRTLEWGCPVNNETVKANNQKSALNQLITECLEQASKAAKEKPEVAAVIQASVLVPDLDIYEESKGIHIVNGTIFLETIVTLVKR